MRDEDCFALKCRTSPSAAIELLSFFNPSYLRDRDRPVCWANGPMASHEPSRVPPPHDNPAAAAARPKPLWQPWSDSDDDRDLTSRPGENDCSSGSKELPTRTKKERRRHERHHELLSTAARARKERATVEADDTPLDMSTGRRASPPPYPAAAGSSGSGGLPSYPMRYPSPPDYASARPSVITCASSVRSSPAPSCPSPCGSTSSSASQPRTASGSPPPSSNRIRPAADGERLGAPQRREIISSGMCDPVIDEHFRRSLGERYTHLFASSPSSTSSTSNLATTNESSSRDGAANKMPSTVNVTGLSVDDHFAKALGETWLKLQSETKEKEANSDSQPGSPLPSSAQRQGLLLT